MSPRHAIGQEADIYRVIQRTELSVLDLFLTNGLIVERLQYSAKRDRGGALPDGGFEMLRDFQISPDLCSPVRQAVDDNPDQ